MTTYTKLAFRGAAIVLIFALVAAVLAYGIRLLLAQNLSIEDYGLFYAVFSFLGFIGIFKTMGFDKAIVRFIPELIARKKAHLAKSAIIYTLIVTLLVNIAIITLVYLFSSFLSVSFFHTEKAAPALRLLAIAFFLESFFFVIKNAFQGFKNMLLFSGVDVVRYAIILSLLFVGFRYYDGIGVPIAAYAIASTAAFIVFYLVLKKAIFRGWDSLKVVYDKKLVRRMFKYGIIVFTSGASAAILSYTDTMLLTYFSGLQEVAMYNVAMPLARLFLYIGISIGSILLPLTAEMYAAKKMHLVKDGLQSVYKYAMIAALPGIAVLLVFANLVIGILFGEKFVQASLTLQLLSMGMVFGIVQLTNMNFFLGINKPKVHAKIFFMGAGINLVVGLLLIPPLGTVGAAGAIILSYIVMMVWGIFEVRKLTGMIIPYGLWSKIFAAACIFLAVMFILKKYIVLNVWAETAIVLGMSSLIYLGCLFLFKIISMPEIRTILQRIR